MTQKKKYSGKAVKISGTTTEIHSILLILLVLSPIIIFTAISSALEISIDSPNSVEVGERFYVSIDADTTETNDVKIFVHDSSDDKITQNEYISEIYGDEWQSSWNYIKEVFPKDNPAARRRPAYA